MIMLIHVSLSGQADARVMDGVPHYDSVSHLLSPIHTQQCNGSVSSYHLDSVHGDMSPVCWSPGEHESPEGKGQLVELVNSFVWLFYNVSWGASIIQVWFFIKNSQNFDINGYFRKKWSIGRGVSSVRLQCKRPLLWLADIFAYEMSITCGFLAFKKTFSVFLL